MIRIRRDEVLSPSSSTRSSPEVVPADDEEARARLETLLAFDTFTPENTNQAAAHTEEEDGEQEFEFRLFSTAAPSKKATDSATTAKPETDSKIGKQERLPSSSTGDAIIKTQKLKIRLRSPTPDGDAPLEDGRFVVPFRGWEYYFTRPELMNVSARDPARLETEETNRRKEFEDIAVTGGEVLKWAQTANYPGCHLPWRVMHLNPKRHRVPKSLLQQDHQQGRRPPGTEDKKMMFLGVTAEGEKKKSKPGKKRRIILRTRAAAVAATATAAAATADMTEAEKRNKKNREKKIRKRQRERERKAALNSSTGNAVVPGAETASIGGDSSG